MNIEFFSLKSEYNVLIAKASLLEISKTENFVSNGATLPDGFVEIYFSKHDPISIKMNERNLSTYSNSAFVIGQSTSKIEFKPKGEQKLISLKIQPWATSMFLPDKADLYKDKAIAIDDLVSPKLSLLQRMVVNSSTKEEAFKHIEDFLIQSQKTSSKFSKLIYFAVNYIFQNHIGFSVKKLTNLLNVSRQYLERQFVAQIGISPKQFARVIRIRSLTNHFKSNPNISLTELSYKFGYFDQSHFIRDFQLIAATSPKKFLSSNNFMSSNYQYDNSLNL
ncbi:helix-turn-helix domain-containing protein [uncultured Psychroserpens sp.]|uniref:helix-turn-helix domain-containing protein n=1 Tax=uncultured Psychroserpens sp. TaxID=255436 RepID=UPI00262A3C83|nr:helix-turn-helix domain-containing protein [uncultured Psychroserpens sp.]